MSKKVKKLIFLACLLIAVFLAVNFSLAATDVWGGDTNGTNFQTTTTLGGADLRVTIARIIRIFLGFLGIIAVGLIIYAGFVWMTAGGEAQKIEKAKKILIGAVIGLALCLASFAIASFILNNLIGATGGSDSGDGGGPGDSGGSVKRGTSIKGTSPKDGTIMLPQNTQAVFFFTYPIEVK